MPVDAIGMDVLVKFGDATLSRGLIMSAITISTNRPDMTSLAASVGLQNATKYWTKVMRKRGPAGNRVR